MFAPPAIIQTQLLANRTVRLVMACGALLICVATVTWLAPLGVANQGRLQRTTTSALNQVALPPVAEPGYWTFANCAWQVRTTQLSLKEVLGKLSSIEQPLGTTDISRRLDASEFVELAQAYGLEQTSNESQVTYRLDGPNLGIRLVTNNATEPQLIAAAVAIKSQDDIWEFHEVQPTTDWSSPSADNLLPLPKSAQRNCSRRSVDGELLLELVTLQATADELLQSWREAGWEVRRSEWGVPTNFSYLCVRGEDLVYAWSATVQPHELLLSKSKDAVLQRDRF